MARHDASSPLLLDEFFAAGDERFLDHLLKFHEPKKLASIADRWKKDSRPWARRQIFAYLELPFAAAGHEPLVKRLFKHAEERRDHELMAHFACAFDRLIRRKRATRWAWDPATRSGGREEYLASPRDVMPHVRQRDRRALNPKTLEPVDTPAWFPPNARLFSYRTRHYLRRRAWRYFRRMGHQRPREYAAAAAGLLRLYADGSLDSGSSLLDSRSLMHACFRGADDVLEFTPGHVKLRPGRSLAEMSAAPSHPGVWQSPASAAVLLDLAAAAQSRPARAWAVQLVRRMHFNPPPALAPAQLLPLLDHADEIVQQLGADLLERAVGLETLGVEDWLRLLQTRNLAALETIARVMRRHVTHERVTLAQAVELACAAPVPVARLGFELVSAKPRSGGVEERAIIARLADARSAGLAGEIATWALSVLGADDVYDVDLVVRFFDSLLRPTRQAAWAWLTATPAPRAHDDPALWSRLIETPYDDLRLRLVEALRRRATLPGVAADKLGPAVWAPVLLGIHRGGRAKLTALRQAGDAIARDPQNAEPLLPVLAVGVRSVRLPEARHGLAALVRAADAHPPLADAVRRHFPELELGEAVCR